MAQVFNLSDYLPAQADESEMLDILLQDYIAGVPDIVATRAQRDERYAGLARDCEARRNRSTFHVVT